jgi:hypothetical protein
MKTCVQCGTEAGAAALKCKTCGAFLVAAPTPPTRMPTPILGDAPPARSPDPREEFFAPATFTPIAVAAPPDRTPRAPTRRLLAIALLIAGGFALYTTFAHAGHSSSKPPIVLAPTAESGGLPSLDEAVRVQSEATRQQALSAAQDAMSSSQTGKVDVAMLEQVQPMFKWLSGTESSTGPKEVSFLQTDAAFTVAVSTSSRHVCVFGRLDADNNEEYVTLGNVNTCRAVDAPSNGWTANAGAGGARSGVVPNG